MFLERKNIIISFYNVKVFDEELYIIRRNSKATLYKSMFGKKIQMENFLNP